MAVRVPALIAVLACCLPLAACGEAELYGGLTEGDANEMVAIVQTADIGAQKMSKDGKTWSLDVAPKDFASAVALLQARGYPREKFETLGEVFKQQGFVSSPVEEHARLIYGLSQELSNTISSIDGVIFARVLIAIPETDPLSETQKPSSASVLVKYDPRVDLTSQVGAIKSLVVNGVEGLPYDRVTVVLTPAEPLSLPERKAGGDHYLVSAGLAGLAILVILAGLAALWRLGRRKMVAVRVP